jgi:hypothetical protein
MHTARSVLGRRRFIGLALAGAAWGAQPAGAAARRIKWSDLIPDGVPYGEIVSNGRVDPVNDVWIPEFDANGSMLNTDLDGADITLAGYMIPLEMTSEGVTEFVLVPFVGACIHVPPPPPNQLVFVTAEVPATQRNLWEAVLVTGTLSANMKLTDVAQVGYEMKAWDVEEFRR